jgi:hypothetical protein
LGGNAFSPLANRLRMPSSVSLLVQLLDLCRQL